MDSPSTLRSSSMLETAAIPTRTVIHHSATLTIDMEEFRGCSIMQVGKTKTKEHFTCTSRLSVLLFVYRGSAPKPLDRTVIQLEYGRFSLNASGTISLLSRMDKYRLFQLHKCSFMVYNGLSARCKNHCGKIRYKIYFHNVSRLHEGGLIGLVAFCVGTAF